MNNMILPHGNKLINKILSQEKREEILSKTEKFKFIVLDEEKIKDVKNIANGVYSPLNGFLKQKSFQSVVSDMRLKDGTVWSIPIVLDISDSEHQDIKKEKKILLLNQNKNPVAVLKNIEFYSNNKGFFAENVYGTLDRNHPGVNETYNMGNYLVGGEIGLIDRERQPFPEYNFTPKETRKAFQERGWNTVAAFQTRNVPHRGHEFLQKYALSKTDGLFIQPVIGKKKSEDFKDEFILASYEVLIDRYHSKDKVFLGILPLKMRYAGPREAIFHAIIRKNFGCSHFIIGRDHAGVGKYYAPYAAQEIFNNFKNEEIGVKLIKCPETIYCNGCQKHVFLNSCSHSEQDKMSFSGTKLRESIKNKEQPPFYIIRPEVYFLLANSNNPLIDNLYQNRKNKKGFTLWFTGLPQSGKTTVADAVYKILKEKGINAERLDGDIVRKSLSKDLGFSKEDREENIRRVSSVAKLFSQSGIGVLASFISPYKEQRQELREKIPNFIEIFVNAPLEVCEKRDTKGFYKKARTGEIKNFTGISHPYESPTNPDIELRTDIWTIEECTEKVIEYLNEKKYI